MDSRSLLKSTKSTPTAFAIPSPTPEASTPFGADPGSYRGDVFQDSSQIYARPGFGFNLFSTIGFVSNTVPQSYYLFTIGADGKYTPQLYGASSRFNSLFVEDNWKVSERLTVTAGLRYDNFGNPVPYGSTAQPFVPMFPGAGSTFQEQALATTTHVTRQAFTQSQNPNFMPRIGFAYTPFNDRLTLIHGGVGLYENAPTPFQIASNLPTQPPNRISLCGKHDPALRRLHDAGRALRL